MAQQQRLEPVTMRGVRLLFRNFTGKQDRYNPPGARNFGVVIPDDDVARAMEADGWNVKWLEPRDQDDDEGGEAETPTPWLPGVKVAYDRGRPPKITLINQDGERRIITEETVSLLDGVDITKVDLIINPRPYETGGRAGIASYLRTMFVTIEEDELEQEYSQNAKPQEEE